MNSKDIRNLALVTILMLFGIISMSFYEKVWMPFEENWQTIVAVELSYLYFVLLVANDKNIFKKIIITVGLTALMSICATIANGIITFNTIMIFILLLSYGITLNNLLWLIGGILFQFALQTFYINFHEYNHFIFTLNYFVFSIPVYYVKNKRKGVV